MDFGARVSDAASGLKVRVRGWGGKHHTCCADQPSKPMWSEQNQSRECCKKPGGVGDRRLRLALMPLERHHRGACWQSYKRSLRASTLGRTGARQTRPSCRSRSLAFSLSRSFCLSVSLSLCPSVPLSLCLSVSLSLCLSVSLSQGVVAPK